jgi:hypothetical protein
MKASTEKKGFLSKGAIFSTSSAGAAAASSFFSSAGC